MIEPQRAAVRPRASANGEALLLEEEVRCLLDAGTRGVVALRGPTGSGKTTALQHLAAVLPPDAPVALLDGWRDASCWAPRADHLVIYAVTAPEQATLAPEDLASYQIA